jgi:hypothetical protein
VHDLAGVPWSSDAYFAAVSIAALIFTVLVRVNSDSLNKRFCMCTFRSPQTILSLNALIKNALNSQYLECFLRCAKYSFWSRLWKRYLSAIVRGLGDKCYLIVVSADRMFLLMTYREMWGLWVRNMFFPRSRWGVMKLYWCYRPRSPQNIVLDVLRSFPIFASQGLRLEKGDPKHNPWLAKMIQNMKIKKNIIL